MHIAKVIEDTLDMREAVARCFLVLSLLGSTSLQPWVSQIYMSELD